MGFLCVAAIMGEIPVIFNAVVGVGDFRGVDTGERDVFLFAIGAGDGGGGLGDVGIGVG